MSRSKLPESVQRLAEPLPERMDVVSNALLTIVCVVDPLPEIDQERVLNAACAFFGHYPPEKPGEMEKE